MIRKVYRKWIAEKEYIQSFQDRGETVPPFLVFQPYTMRKGIRGYLIPCPSDDPNAEIFEVLTTDKCRQLE